MATAKKRAPTTVDPKGEFPFDVPTHMFSVFTALARHREAVLEQAFRPLGINVPRYRALAVITQMQPCGMTELADISAVDRTTMTRTIDQLVAAGLVERATPPTDRRQVLLTATPTGAAVTRKAHQAVYRVNRRALEGLSDHVQRTVVRAQQSMLANLVQDPELTRRVLTLRRDDSRG
jgi:MarR family transcriptional regulator, lower aerobic nicotinate degradation pathway regulator